MPIITRQKEQLMRAGAAKDTQEFLTLGTVVDTNDPQQMGRVRAVCVAWGDTFSTPVEDLPWCMYAAPFGGQLDKGTRGPGVQSTKGGVAYGMWAIPKVGAQVLVACLDGDPMYRVYIGCVFDQLTPHTMPHGRFKYEDHPALQKDVNGRPFGPYSSRENFIEPFNTNIKQAFGNKSEPNFEWRTRGADYTVANVTVDELEHVVGKAHDDLNAVHDDWTSTQGYAVNRTDPFRKSSFTDKNYDSQVYSITTPGFHAISMDDRIENCRMRFRTPSGHQILMDDTNERIYIQTAKGNNWIEMDEDGNIDIYTSNKVSVRTEKDINLSADETIRMHAKKGIHMYTDDEIRMHARKDVHVLSEQNFRFHSQKNTFLQADQNVYFKASQSFYLTATKEINEKAGSTLKLTSGTTTHIRANADILETSGKGKRIHLNGPVATEATEAQSPNEQKAFWTHRVPQHEPWGRSMTKTDFTHDPEFPYQSKQINRSERGSTVGRGRFWRR